jgi:hypothetical protein
MLTDFVSAAACQLYANSPDLVAATFSGPGLANFWDLAKIGLKLFEKNSQKQMQAGNVP